MPGDEQRRHGVAVAAVEAAPLGHHAEEPGVEPVLPVGVAGRYVACQGADMVAPVPFVMYLPEVFVDGVVAFDVVGPHVAAHVVLGYLDAFGAGVEGEGADGAGVCGMEVKAVVRAVFGVSHHGVVAELVAAAQMVFHLFCHDCHLLVGLEVFVGSGVVCWRCLGGLV